MDLVSSLVLLLMVVLEIEAEFHARELNVDNVCGIFGSSTVYAVGKTHSNDKTYTRTTAPPRFTTDAVDKIHELVHSNDGTYMLLTIGAVDSNEGITYNIYMVSMVDAVDNIYSDDGKDTGSTRSRTRTPKTVPAATE